MFESFGRAWRIVLKTSPYIVFRIAVYAAVWLAALVVLAPFVLIYGLFGPWAFAVSLGSALWAARRFALWEIAGIYLVRALNAGHLALLVGHTDTSYAPLGITQITWTDGFVRRFFPTAAHYAEFTAALREVIRSIAQTYHATTPPSFPGLRVSSRAIAAISELAVPYCQAVLIMARFDAREDHEPSTAATRLTLLCQAWPRLIDGMITRTILAWLATIAVGVLLIVPVGLASLPLAGPLMSVIAFATLVWIALAMKWAVIDPVILTLFYADFQEEMGALHPDAEVMNQLAARCPAFESLRGSD